MTVEIETGMPAAEVLETARRFFTEEDSPYQATPVSESAQHLTLATFRSRLAISARTEDGRTLVRVSTLRPDSSVGKFLALVRHAGADRSPCATTCRPMMAAVSTCGFASSTPKGSRTTIAPIVGRRELSAERDVSVELAPGATVGDLLVDLERSLGPIAPRPAVAVNHVQADRGHVLEVDDEVALLPPVAGG